MKRKQRTIEKKGKFSGAGLFSGVETEMTFLPAGPDTGCVFVRTDLEGKPEVRASAVDLAGRVRRTAYDAGAGVEVETVEHVLAVLYALGIDNVRIEISSAEPPAADGSARPFVETLVKCGICEQDAERDIITVSKPVHVEEDGASIVLIPGGENLRIVYTLDYSPDIPVMYFEYEVSPETFPDHVAPARTFCLEREVESLQAMGIGKGANYNNTLVVRADGTVLENETRFDDEFARHKVLDLLGDLFLLNADLRGTVMAFKSGHSLNIRFAKKLLAEWPAQRTADAILAKEPVMDIERIKKMLPHRYPFLLIDRVVELEPNVRAVGIKNATFNEHFFQGHFPNEPIMPGVLQVEAMAQLSCAILMHDNEDRSVLAVLLGLDNVRFRKPIVPGDTIIIEANAVKLKGRHGIMHAEMKVGGKVVSSADIKFMIIDRRSRD